MQTSEQKNTIDLSTLTLPLQQELVNFYQILIEKQRNQTKNENSKIDNSQQIMQLAGKISAFKNITDPVLWQQQQREEWNER